MIKWNDFAHFLLYFCATEDGNLHHRPFRLGSSLPKPSAALSRGSHLAKTLLVPGFPNAHQQVEGRLYGYSEISLRAGRGSGLYVVVTSFLLFTRGSLFRSPFAVREQNARAPSTCWSASLLTPPPAHLKIKCYRQLGCWGLPSGSDLDIFKWITWKGHLFPCLLPPSEDLEDIYILRHN